MFLIKTMSWFSCTHIRTLIGSEGWFSHNSSALFLQILRTSEEAKKYPLLPVRYTSPTPSHFFVLAHDLSWRLSRSMHLLYVKFHVFKNIRPQCMMKTNHCTFMTWLPILICMLYMLVYELT